MKTLINMEAMPSETNWSPEYYGKILNTPQENSLTLPNSREEIIQYLKWWNTTNAHNGSTLDIISYEQLIYYELKYPNDEEIQNLVTILKQKITKFYELKAHWLDILIDKSLYKDLDHIQSIEAIRSSVYTGIDEHIEGAAD